jgi:hypothetical protein
VGDKCDSHIHVLKFIPILLLGVEAAISQIEAVAIPSPSPDLSQRER